ncbi:MAG: protein kinase domain-containing protein, partial [Tepidisphaeraceae bacterium]
MPSPNQRVSEYVLDERIGAGTFGEVWRARHHVWTDQFVAIKIPTDPQYLRNLQREGAAVHGLVHPNIVRAIGFDPYAPTPYLTMEYIPGTSLRPLISKRSLSVDDVVAILKQVLAGLGHAHERGLVHRDVKPENILIHERAARDGYAAEGVVKVTDFGLGSATTATAVGSIVYSASLERGGGEIAGSLDYMAPEQRSGADVDARADLYACGVMLYEMLTGERPAGTDVPSDVNPNAPRYLDDLFRRSYARLDKRFKDAAEFAAGLTAPARTIVSSIPSLTPPVPMPSSGATGMNGEKVLCPVCSGRGIKPGAEWTFCDHCRGMGKLRGRSPQGEIEIECPKCRGHGTQAPEKCANCRG